MRWFFVFLFLQCASTQSFWTQYAVKYVGTEQLEKTLTELQSKNFEYRVFSREDGVSEIHYRKITK
jgi:hypothetical protein